MKNLFLAAIFAILPASGAFAEVVEAVEAVAKVSETTYIFNTLLFLICGFLVMFMAAGFAMLEAGMVQSKSVAVILTKNIGLYSIAGIMFYIFGYNLMYMDVNGGYFGTLQVWSADDSAAAAGDFSAGYAASSDWFFQMVFVATTASIISGTLAERVKLWPFFIFTAILTAFIYPISGSWKWGAGWLDELGFQDFAGSTLVHSVGGWAALTGCMLLGPRIGRFAKDGTSTPIPSSSFPLVAMGTFILWLGWFGFNGGSQLALGSGADAIAIANIFVNTNIAAAGGVIAVVALSSMLSKRVNLPLVLNGALAGLVSITAEPLTPTGIEALFIGAIGGVLMVGATKLLETMKIDDVVGAIPVHLVAGIWGTLVVPFTNSDATYYVQAVGIASIGLFTTVVSFVLWAILKYTVGIRLDWSKEEEGGDVHEIGVRAYNLELGNGVPKA